MKSYRVDSSKGINVVSDKAVLPPGHVTIADGVDVRSGQVRPFLGPLTVESASSSVNCLYSYRNKFFTSVEQRSYVAETVNGQDRIYYSKYGGSPQKHIEGTTIPLGFAAPTSAPIASNNTSSGMSLTVTQNPTGGIYATGTYKSYRVAAVTNTGTQVPCGSRTITFSNTSNINTHSATLVWTAVKGATKYIIFAGNAGEEKRAYDVGPAILSVTDDGSWPSGEPVSNYEDSLQYAYIYTFVREMKGIVEESGPSPVSQVISTAFGRQVTFDVVSDGFFTQETAVTKSSGITLTPSLSVASATVSDVVYNSFMNTTMVTLSGSIDAKNDDVVVFSLAGSQKGTSYKVKVGSSNTTLIINELLSSIPIVKGDTVTQTKTFFEWTPGSEAAIADGDAVLIKSTGITEISNTAIYPSRLETPSSPGNIRISIPVVTATHISATVTSITYIPNDGYITYKNLYRTSVSNGYLLVEKLPVATTTYIDSVGTDFLKDPPTSYYTENGVAVIFDKPPLGLTGLTSHYGMLFGIDGNTVRCTPINQPHAWPAVFVWSFDFKPMALASFAGSLIVLCENALYRLDGTQPTQLAINLTKSHDGCIAPYSVQKTSDHGLIYLSRRGLMIFDGMDSRCISDQSVSSRFWQAPSYIPGDSLRYLLLPTLASHNYAALAYEDGIRNDISIGFAQHANHIASGAIKDIKSFLWNGKYFIFWSNVSGNYGAHTCVCVDLKREGLPITTLPLRLRDAHTNEVGRVFSLYNSSSTGIQAFTTAESLLGVDMSSVSSVDSVIGELFVDESTLLPFHIRTGQQCLGNIAERKRFKYVEFHGFGVNPGTVRVRIYIDGIYICDGLATLSETPDKKRRVNIPIGKQMGYTIDVELCGCANIRAIEFTFEEPNSQS